ncbi:hypothetical protein EON63_13635 [archaeon]|nr:MAG: hypothetical protein EON63_13635 [archaeon]
MGRFTSALFIVYGIGYPVGNSAVLGIFSSLQKTGWSVLYVFLQRTSISIPIPILYSAYMHILSIYTH